MPVAKNGKLAPFAGRHGIGSAVTWWVRRKSTVCDPWISGPTAARLCISFARKTIQEVCFSMKANICFSCYQLVDVYVMLTIFDEVHTLITLGSSSYNSLLNLVILKCHFALFPHWLVSNHKQEVGMFKWLINILLYMTLYFSPFFGWQSFKLFFKYSLLHVNSYFYPFLIFNSRGKSLFLCRVHTNKYFAQVNTGHTSAKQDLVKICQNSYMKNNFTLGMHISNVFVKCKIFKYFFQILFVQ